MSQRFGEGLSRWALLERAAWVGVILGSLAPSVAEACGRAYCVTVTAPASGTTIPANAPALIVANPDAPPLTADTVALVDAAGADVAIAVQAVQGHHEVRAQLDPGTDYTLRFAARCDAAPGDGSDEGWSETAFRTGPVAPIPERFGSVAVSFNGVGTTDVPTQCGSCSVKRTAAVAHFQVVPVQEAQPWLPLTRFILRVDGEVWARSAFGSGPVDGHAGGALVGGNSFDDVYAVCERGTEVVSFDGLTPGTHQLSWSAEIAGVGEIPMQTLTVTLSCDGASAFPSPPDACRGVPDAGTEEAPVPAGGCAGGGASMLAVLSGVVLARRWRR